MNSTRNMNLVSNMSNFRQCFLSLMSLIMAIKLKESNGYHLSIFETEDNKSVCITKPCILAAAKILQNMDPSIDPCEDFYSFACGEYEKTHYVMTEKDIPVVAFQLPQQKMLNEIKFLLENPTAPGDPLYFTVIRNAFRTCLDSDRLKELGVQPLKDVISKIAHWPLLDGINWQEDYYDWLNVSSSLMKDYSITPMLYMDLNEDGVLEFKTFAFRGHDLQLLSDQEIESAYRTYIRKSFQLFTNESVKEDVENIMEALHTMANVSKRWFESLPTTVLDLYNVTESLDWLSVFQRYLPDVTNETYIEINMNRNEFEGWITLIESTDTRNLANLQFWNLIESHILYLEGPIRIFRKEFLDVAQKYLPMEKEDRPTNSRLEYCLVILNDGLRFGIKGLYAQTFLSEEKMELMLNISEELHLEMKNTFASLEWLDDESKQEVLAWIDSVLFLNPSPKEVFNVTAVEDYYKDLTLDEEHFLENIFRLKPFIKKKNELDELNNITSFGCPYCDEMISSYYYYPITIIGIPLSGLRSNFLDPQLPKYFTFGETGVILGHELTHVANAVEKFKDGFVNLSGFEWTENMTEIFASRSRCLIDLYNNLRYPLLHILPEGEKQLNENLADHTGLNMSRRAYEKWLKENGPEPQLPGLEFTPQQLFWLVTANMWCQVDNVEILKKYSEDVHGYPKYRLLNSFANLPQFASDFNCPAQSPMNPSEKCLVW